MSRKACITLALRDIKYYFREAFKSIWHNGLMTLASVTTVTGCLLLFGIFLLFSININYITHQIESQCDVRAFININYTEEQAEKIREQAELVQNVDDVVLETKDMAYQNYREMLGEDAAALDGLETEGFLRHSLKITLFDIRNSDSVIEEVSKIEGVEEVRNRKDILDKIISFTSFVRSVSFYSMALLCAIAVFIISNTIKLAVHSREREIHIMKYVGATDWFIRWPFIIEGIIVGLVGAGISLGIIIAAYSSLYNFFNTFLYIFSIRPLSEIFSILLLAIIAFGGIMGALGSLIAVSRHLDV